MAEPFDIHREIPVVGVQTTGNGDIIILNISLVISVVSLPWTDTNHSLVRHGSQRPCCTKELALSCALSTIAASQPISFSKLMALRVVAMPGFFR